MKMDILYYSTNSNSNPVFLKQAILMGQAPDRGLFMPDTIPEMNIHEISSFRDMNYSNIAFTVMNKFLSREVPEAQLRKMTKEVYCFDVPLKKVQENLHIMWLDQGPSASFKDFAVGFMARLIDYLTDKKLVVLVATSGDTGGAVAHAFNALSKISVVILFPKQEITTLQRKQMTTVGKNIKAVAVKGKFDDCQVIVKQALSDPHLKDLNLTSANSINLGRLLPQAVYYFYAHSRVARENEKVVFSVPSGNFGDLIGGLIAKKMGLPVKRFIVAVNENDEFVKFLETGNYEPIRPSRKCLSSAMNVGHPSNLARLIDLYGGQMDEKGHLNKKPDLSKIRKDMYAVSTDDNETKKIIKKVYQKYNIILEPHGAVAWAGIVKYLKDTGDESPLILLETAHPAKFTKELHKLGIHPELPDSMKNLENKHEIDNYEMDNRYNSFKEFLRLLDSKQYHSHPQMLLST